MKYWIIVHTVIPDTVVIEVFADTAKHVNGGQLW